MPRLDLNPPDDIHNALAGWAVSKGLSKRSAALLLMTRMLAEELGDDSLQFSPPERGGWQGNEKSLQNLVSHVDRLTDKGRNDPTEDRDGFAQSLRAWQAERGLLNLHEYITAHNLTAKEVEAGIKHGTLIGYLPPAQFIKSVRSPYPVGLYYFEHVAPTPAQRRSMQENTLLSRIEAAHYLNIEPKEFDKLRKKVGLQRAGRFSTPEGHFGNLFRLSDVTRLAE